MLDDPGVFAARLRDYRWRLFSGLVWARLVILAGLAAIMPAERQHGPTIFRVLVVEYVALVAWSAAGALRRRQLFDLLDRRPRLVWVELAMFAQAVLVGGGWRTPFDIYSWPAMGLASVFLAPAATLAAVLACCAAFALGTVGSVMRGDPLAAHVSSREVVGALFGYGVVGAAFWCVRLRLDELAVAANAYRVQAASAREAELRAVAARERTEIAFALHSRLRQAFPAIGLRLGLLRELAGEDTGTHRSLERMGAAVHAADARLDELVRELEGQEGWTSTAQRSTSGSDR